MIQSSISNLLVVVLFLGLAGWLLTIVVRLKVAFDAYSQVKNNQNTDNRVLLTTVAKLREQPFSEFLAAHQALEQQGVHMVCPSMVLPCRLGGTRDASSFMDAFTLASAGGVRNQERAKDFRHHQRELSLFSSSSVSTGAEVAAPPPPRPGGVVGIGGSRQHVAGVYRVRRTGSHPPRAGDPPSSAPPSRRQSSLSFLADQQRRPSFRSKADPHNAGQVASAVAQLQGGNEQQQQQQQQQLEGGALSDAWRCDGDAAMEGGSPRHPSIALHPTTVSMEGHDGATFLSSPKGGGGDLCLLSSITFAATSSAAHYVDGGGGGASCTSACPGGADPLHADQPSPHQQQQHGGSGVIMSVFAEYDSRSLQSQAGLMASVGLTSTECTTSYRSPESHRHHRAVDLEQTLSLPREALEETCVMRSDEEDDDLACHAGQYSLPAVLQDRGERDDEEDHKSSLATPPPHALPLQPFVRPPTVELGEQHPSTLTLQGAAPQLRAYILLTTRQLIEEELRYNASLFRREQPFLHLTGHGAPQPTATSARRIGEGAPPPSADSDSPQSSRLRVCRRDGVRRGGRCRCQRRGHQLFAPPCAATRVASFYDGGVSSRATATLQSPLTTRQRSATAAEATEEHRTEIPGDASARELFASSSSGTTSRRPGASGDGGSGAAVEEIQIALTEEEWNEISAARTPHSDDPQRTNVFLVVEKCTAQAPVSSAAHVETGATGLGSGGPTDHLSLVGAVPIESNQRRPHATVREQSTATKGMTACCTVVAELHFSQIVAEEPSPMVPSTPAVHSPIQTALPIVGGLPPPASATRRGSGVAPSSSQVSVDAADRNVPTIANEDDDDHNVMHSALEMTAEGGEAFFSQAANDGEDHHGRAMQGSALSLREKEESVCSAAREFGTSVQRSPTRTSRADGRGGGGPRRLSITALASKSLFTEIAGASGGAEQPAWPHLHAAMYSRAADVDPALAYHRIGHRVFRMEPVFAVHEENDDVHDDDHLVERQREGVDDAFVEMRSTHPPQQQPHNTKRQPLCMICYHRAATVILLPCHHYGFCVGCARRLGHCPVCRREIAHTLFVLEDVS